MTEFSSKQVRYAMYEYDGEWVLPNKSASGGWDSSMQSGHAISPLLGHFVEKVPTLVPMLTVRSIINIMRPVIMKPLKIKTDIIREGKKLQIVRTALLDDGVEVADISVVRVRLGESPVIGHGRTYPDPEDCELVHDKLPKSLELRIVEGSEINQPCAFWYNLSKVDLIAGEAFTPYTLALSLSDLGSGMTSGMTMKEWSFPNIDLGLQMFRQPQSEWLLLDAETESENDGVALVSGIVADRYGVFGRTHQHLIVDKK